MTTQNTNNKFTPGPWRVSSTSNNHVYADTTQGITVIAKTVGCDNGAANAHLIAAAPEMLDALEMMIKECHDTIGKFKPNLYNHVRSVIAQAKGE